MIALYKSTLTYLLNLLCSFPLPFRSPSVQLNTSVCMPYAHLASEQCTTVELQNSSN